ncbi:MAG: MerR family transcriptional regulator [Anaerolineae bacterium]|nr:MerR family transcriptional regulator [Anaerolineae bacterium]
MVYTVKTVADLAGVTVRALHHYDRIGLLQPESVSPAGYRLYSDADLEQLQQILFFRELGFGLKDIQAILHSPRFDRREALLEHRKLLLEKKARLERLIHSVEQTIAAMDGAGAVSREEMFLPFDDEKMDEYRKEARARWGSVVDESYEGLAKLTREEQSALWAEAQAITLGMADLVGRDPADTEVQALVDRWYRLMNQNFWSCSVEAFRNLGEMYVQDGRFSQFYDRVKPGLAQFMRDAMRAYCDDTASRA